MRIALHPAGLAGVDYFGVYAVTAAHLHEQAAGGALTNRAIGAQYRDAGYLDVVNLAAEKACYLIGWPSVPPAQGCGGKIWFRM